MSVTPNHHYNTSVVLPVGALVMGGNSCCLITPSRPPSTGTHTSYTCAQVATRGRGWQQMQPLSSSSNPNNLVAIWDQEWQQPLDRNGKPAFQGGRVAVRGDHMQESSSKPQSIIHCLKHDPLSHQTLFTNHVFKDKEYQDSHYRSSNSKHGKPCETCPCLTAVRLALPPGVRWMQKCKAAMRQRTEIQRWYSQII